jgi:hypothetical protein
MKRHRIDTVAGAIATAAGLARDVSPPEHVSLDECDMPYWESVVAEFAHAEWTAHQLEVAAQLAKAMADLETERNALRAEGYVLKFSGKVVANPRHGIARDLTNSVMSLRRNLSLHARAQGGEARDVAKRRGHAKAIEAALTVDDDFIGRPTVN